MAEARLSFFNADGPQQLAGRFGVYADAAVGANASSLGDSMLTTGMSALALVRFGAGRVGGGGGVLVFLVLMAAVAVGAWVLTRPSQVVPPKGQDTQA